MGTGYGVELDALGLPFVSLNIRFMFLNLCIYILVIVIVLLIVIYTYIYIFHLDIDRHGWSSFPVIFCGKNLMPRPGGAGRATGHLRSHHLLRGHPGVVPWT